MGINESVDSYRGRMNDILLRMGNHHIPNNFLRNIFRGRLHPFKLKNYVRERAPAIREDVFVLAKAWGGVSRRGSLYFYNNYYDH